VSTALINLVFNKALFAKTWKNGFSGKLVAKKPGLKLAYCF
jgi:hypothetical protein